MICNVTMAGVVIMNKHLYENLCYYGRISTMAGQKCMEEIGNIFITMLELLLWSSYYGRGVL